MYIIKIIITLKKISAFSILKNERERNNLLKKKLNWKKATSWPFTKFVGLDFGITGDKSSQWSERDKELMQAHVNPAR